MGCDIHSWAQKKVDGKWEDMKIGNGKHFLDDGYESDHPFDWRNYKIFTFLGGVRDYYEMPAISEDRGFPSDFNGKDYGYDPDEYWGHSPYWLSLEELLNFDYDKETGEMTTYREFLKDTGFFPELERLKSKGVERIVFYFDN